MPAQSRQKRQSNADSGDKPAKRTRVSRACDQCRIAREKCDGLQPICSTCSKAKRKCAYTTNPKKRGIQPGYIRTLELALAWLFQHNPENERILSDKLGSEGASSILLSRDSKESNRLHRRWRKTKFCTDADKLLSGGETSRHDQGEPLSPQTDDESEEEKSHPEPQNEERYNYGSPFHLPAKSAGRSVAQAAIEHSISLPTASYMMFDLYFNYIQCWFPICEKHDLLKFSYSYPTEGLIMSSSMPDSGSHAELWSVLTVASLYNQQITGLSDRVGNTANVNNDYYNIAKTLIPCELGSFEIGHVKALLNLAIYHMSQASPEAAWWFVGSASRVFELMIQINQTGNSRWRHVMYGCSLLDALVAFRLGRPPYFRGQNVVDHGPIDEDGLEEWQPWSTLHQSSLPEQPRTPVLALSIFNKLLEVVDILSSSTWSWIDTSRDQAMPDRLDKWTKSLPSKLTWVCSDLDLTPHTPPAVLLQMTYSLTLYASRPSIALFHRLLSTMERFGSRVEFAALLPLLECIVASAYRHKVEIPWDDTTATRLQRLYANMKFSFPLELSDSSESRESQDLQGRESELSKQIATPDSIRYPLSLPAPVNLPGRAASVSTQFDIGLPETFPTMNMGDGLDPLSKMLSPDQLDPTYPGVPSDLESFFDELASLDNTTRMESQPQFMQNLGFAPDANMADLFSEYIPMQSSSFLGPDDGERFDQYSFSLT